MGQLTIFKNGHKNFQNVFFFDRNYAEIKLSDLILKKQLFNMNSTINHVLKEENLRKGSYTFLNMLIPANSLIIKSITRR